MLKFIQNIEGNMHTGMFESFITQHWFSSKAKEIWSDVATLQAWLDVEVLWRVPRPRWG